MFALRSLFIAFAMVLSIGVTASAHTQVTDHTFDREVIQSDRPVLVDFSASWCPPCREMAPKLEQLAAEHRGVKVVEVDVDANPRLSRRFNVEVLPTLMVFYRGERVAVSTGAMSYVRLDRFLHGALEMARRDTSRISDHSWFGRNVANIAILLFARAPLAIDRCGDKAPTAYGYLLDHSCAGPAGAA